MGPFVPDLISDQLNLIVALLLGIAFGFVLEQAGFSSSRRLAGVFYGYDFTVLRVFFTATVTAMAGVILLGYAGLLDTDIIFVNPTWLVPTIVGGVIMGLGFIVGGYCPGTSVCAAAIGKVDAVFFVLGGLAGVFVFGEFFPLYDQFFVSTSLGAIKVYDSLGMSQGAFAFALIAVAIGAFAATTLIERRVNRSSAPSLEFKTGKHVAAAAVVFAIGLIILILPDRKSSIIARVSDPAYQSTHQVVSMDADELAFRIVDREPNIRIVDVRSGEEYARLALPGSTNVALRELFGKDWISVLSQRHVRKVVVADDEQQERTACLLLAELGYENLSILKGGFVSFDKTILNPSPYVPTGSRWDSDVKQFREKARIDLTRMIADAKTKGAQQPRKAKKIQGGC
ncbi:MAG TPA: YeeE/YedE thiosulfate transporter family protein [Bacteroidota bacterium]|nr:YeeE/YedE thiosulfate transporter family protein [Bacteroidota bacterium]